MEFNEYQKIAKTTAIYPAGFKLVYPALGLNGEAGEVADKVKKLIRDDQWGPGMPLNETKRNELVKELGDVLWYISACASDLGYDLNQVAQINLDKLSARKASGKLHGSGDNR